MRHITQESLEREIDLTELRLKDARRREDEAKAILDAATLDRRQVEFLASILNELAGQNRVAGGLSASQRAKAISCDASLLERKEVPVK